MPASRYDALRSKRRGANHRRPDRFCLFCNKPAAPRWCYCSDECSELSRAKTIAPALGITEVEALELIRENQRGGR